jgi:hypothetical protein
LRWGIFHGIPFHTTFPFGNFTLPQSPFAINITVREFKKGIDSVKRKIFPDGNTSVEEATSPQLHRPLVDTLKGSYSGDVGRRRSEATLVAFYSSQVAHLNQEQGN